MVKVRKSTSKNSTKQKLDRLLKKNERKSLTASEQLRRIKYLRELGMATTDKERKILASVDRYSNLKHKSSKGELSKVCDEVDDWLYEINRADHIKKQKAKGPLQVSTMKRLISVETELKPVVRKSFRGLVNTYGEFEVTEVAGELIIGLPDKWVRLTDKSTKRNVDLPDEVRRKRINNIKDILSWHGLEYDDIGNYKVRIKRNQYPLHKYQGTLKC